MILPSDLNCKLSLRYCRQVSHLSTMFLQVNEIGNQFPGKSFLTHSRKRGCYFQILFIAPLTSATVLQQNYTTAKEGATYLTLNGFNKVRALHVLILPLNSQCHKGEINGL